MKKNFTLLYADDEPDNLLAFKAIFRRHYKVLTAQSGEEALNLLKNNDVDLIVSDQRMPSMTGVELLEKVREDYPDTIRMVMTGYSNVQSIIDAINKGKVYHYITKPWNVEELKVIIARALENYTLKIKNRRLEEERNRLLMKTAQQEKDNILAQYEILKSQINPHFLFNSMNILSSIIPVNQEKAVEFATKFAKVYRSLLELKEELTVSVEQEVEFIHTYIYLQKMRFEDSLQIELDIPSNIYHKQIPPFALQLLIENAIKHNIVSEDSPLSITINYKNDYLFVANNSQPRGTDKDSTGIGLKNLKARYEMLTDKSLNLDIDKKNYIVSIPLLDF